MQYTLQEAKAEKEYYQAKIAELEYRRRAKELLDAQAVKKTIMKMTQITKDKLFNIPSNLAPELAAETDSFNVEMKLKEAINEALTELSRGAKAV